MESSCVRQSLIPGTSAIYSNYLYQYERVSAFYPQWFGDWEALKVTARSLRFPESRRLAIVAALLEQNGESDALRKLADPGTVAVVTGQQVGLFTGPAYTIFKALTAAKLAQRLSAEGVPAVPVFWLATEDHDLAEVDHAWVFNAKTEPRRLAFKTDSALGGPVGEVMLRDLPIEALREAIAPFPHGPAVLEQVQAAYRSGVTLGAAFRSLLQTLLGDCGLLFLDPLAPAVRHIAAPFLQDAAGRLPELVPALLERNAELSRAGYHTQVNIDADSSLLFAFENGKRLPLRWHEGRFTVRGERPFDAHQSTALSPNALLRPVMQDYLFPTVAYVGGPAEIAYMAQAEVLYSHLLGRMPVIYPRNGFTLLDARAEKLLTKYGLQIPDLLDHHDNVRSRMAAHLVPRPLAQEIASVRGVLDSTLQRLQRHLKSFDVTLDAAAKKSAAKMLYQLDKLARKTARETYLRDDRAAHDSEYLLNLIYPERHLQERFYSIVPFLARFGLDLPQKLFGQVQLQCPDHMVRVI